MSACSLLTDLESRGVELIPEGASLRYRAPQGVMTDHLRATLSTHRDELMALLTRPAPADPDPAAVRIVGTVVGDVWLVLDADALDNYPEILAGKLPVFYADELAALAGRPADDLRLIASVKRTFPGARIIQDTATGSATPEGILTCGRRC